MRRWTLAGLVLLLGVHMWAWYYLDFRAVGKLSFSGFASILVGHLNAAAGLRSSFRP